MLSFSFSAAYCRSSSLQDAYYLRRFPLMTALFPHSSYYDRSVRGKINLTFSTNLPMEWAASRRAAAHVLPCVSCTKLALAHTFTFARVHPEWSSSCFTHILPRWDLHHLSSEHVYVFRGGICVICKMQVRLFFPVGSVWSTGSRSCFLGGICTI